jgi:hypothetical protein
MIGIMLMLCILELSLPANTAYAATRATLSDSKLSIGIGTYGGSFVVNKIESKYKITIQKPVKGATYTFQSSNKKIVTVKASGSEGYLTGVKNGTATITCKQTLNGKTITVGKTIVTVNESSINPTYRAEDLSLGTGSLGSWVAEPICNIEYRIPDATYTYSVNSKNFSIKDTKYNETQAGEGYFGFKQTYTATKPGIYTVTVNETYKDTTRKLGTFKVAVYDLVIADKISIAPNEFFELRSILSHSKSGMTYYYGGDGFNAYDKKMDSVFYITKDKYDDLSLFGNKDGSAKLNIYEGKDEATKKLVGSCTIEVSSDYIAFKESSYITYVGDVYNYLFTRTPSDSKLNAITITSSNEDIISMGEGEPFDNLSRWKSTPLQAGEVTITAKYGNKTATCTVTVYETEEEYWSAVYLNR